MPAGQAVRVTHPALAARQIRVFGYFLEWALRKLALIDCEIRFLLPDAVVFTVPGPLGVKWASLPLGWRRRATAVHFPELVAQEF